MAKKVTKGKTVVGRRLRRLVKNYANAWAEMTWIGGRDPDMTFSIERDWKNARTRLYAEFDRIEEILEEFGVLDVDKVA